MFCVTPVILGYNRFLEIVDKKRRTSLAIDFEFGDKLSGFYLAATETF
jgi:hypothetical protein